MTAPSSRAYIKRVWRVPKDRGAPYYFAALVTKALVKHGWPAIFEADQADLSAQILHHEKRFDAPPDFWAAVSTAVRIAARTHGVWVDEMEGFLYFRKSYVVNSRGQIREYKDPDDDLSGESPLPG